MKTYGVGIIKTKELKKRDIERINVLKNEYWKHSNDEHNKWFCENIGEEDEHILLIAEDELVGYLDIVNVEMIIDNKKYVAKGIGNVCVSRRLQGTGLGSMLMSTVNMYLKQNNALGVLLCRDRLVKFYASHGWKKISGNKYLVVDKEVACNGMYYNSESDFSNIKGDIIFNRNF